MKILGAGLAGLIAGALNENAELYEPFENKVSHQALLRFRSPQIGEALGIPFREVTAYKSIWYRDQSTDKICPRSMVLYSKKVSGRISHRSIRHLEAETRWMAPDNFQDLLKDICTDRIHYDSNVYDCLRYDGPIISTIPINVLASMLQASDIIGIDAEVTTSQIRPIFVTRYRIEDCDAFMTNYYPDLNLGVYRASISGDILIIESMTHMTSMDFDAVMKSFGLMDGHPMTLQTLDQEQRNGKMNKIDEAARKKFILWATMEHGIYSLGRFAIWKDILLDDVYHDILRIKQFINRDKYDHYKEI